MAFGHLFHIKSGRGMRPFVNINTVCKCNFYIILKWCKEKSNRVICLHFLYTYSDSPYFRIITAVIWSVPIFRIFEPRHDKTKNMSVRPAKTQISLGIRPVWSESSLSKGRKLGPLATHWAHSKDSDQTGRMPRLIWVFTGRTATLLVLSCRGSFTVYLFQANFYTVNFELKGDDQATNFFRVNPATGEVSLSQPLFAVDSFSSVTVSMKSKLVMSYLFHPKKTTKKKQMHSHGTVV